MKKKIILLPLASILLYLSLSSSSSGLYSNYTTAGCTCHGTGSPASTTTVAIQLLNTSFSPVTTWVAGQSYYIRITGTQTITPPAPTSYFGFQVAAVKTSTPTTTAGGMTAIASSHVFTSGISVCEHTSPIPATTGTGGVGSTYVRDIPWTAPATGFGNVTFNGVINAVNHNGTDDPGDYWNTGTLSSVPEIGPITSGGGFSTCVGSSVTFSCTPSGGTWASSNTSIATVTSGGAVGGAGIGTATITYTAGGNFVTRVVSVNAAPGTFGGSNTVCQTQTATITNTTSGGTWSASAGTGSVSIISGTGAFTGLTAGTANVTYTVGTCTVATIVTVNPLAAITGTTAACTGFTTTLSNPNPGGTWSSSVTAVGTVSSSGVVSALTAGTTNISYSLPTGCNSGTTVTVSTSPPAIGGTLVVCASATVTATNSVAGGTWSSGGGSGAVTIGSSSGIITGTGAGTTNITYTAPGGCMAIAVATINPLPSPITGSTTICANVTTTLNCFTAGGTWTSGATGVATIGASTGVVTPASFTGGSAPMTYTLSTGCMRTTTVNVNPISPISGTLSLCPGATTTLTSAPAGGAWTSGATGVATVVSGTGFVTAAGIGTAGITYTAGSCSSTAVVTVNAAAAITGGSSVCVGSTLALSNSVTGGTWVSSTTAVGTINSSTGVLSGLSAGTTTITYTTPTSCTSTLVVTVNTTPGAVTGSGGGSFCVSATISASGGTGGTIYYQGATSGGTSTATPSTSQSVSATGTYYFRAQSSGGCWGPEAAISVTVNPAPAAITGNLAICYGDASTLSSTSGGGTWSSSNTSIIQIGSTSGIVTYTSSGTSTISYILPTGCSTTAVVTVNSLPGAITGSTSVCVGSTITLASSTTGGTWSSSSTGVATVGSGSGIVLGVAGGTANITYTAPGTGCFVVQPVIVNPLPNPISGTLSVCVNSTTTLSSSTAGGTWASSNTAVGTINSSGVFTGIAAGTSTVSYTLATGCFMTANVTVNALPGTISGGLYNCLGSSPTLSCGPTGGTWASSTTSVATIGLTSGIVSTATAGTTTITYTLSTGCRTTSIMTVNPLPDPITGSLTLCDGSTTVLSTTTVGGGTWSCGAVVTATIDASGVVSGISPGPAVITFVSSITGCSRSVTITVNPLPAAISGPSTVCVGSNITLTNTSGGGTWSSSVTANATIGSSSGTIAGVAAGTSTISYILPATGCYGTTEITVNPLPGAITGTASACVGTTTTLSSSTPGGVWASSTTSVATIDASTGVVTGVGIGTSTITYTMGTGCKVISPVTINAAPSAGTISGSASVCTGLTITLSSTVSGGTWVSGTPSVATINSSGVVTGVAAGTTIITYTVTNPCATVTSTYNITVTTSASAGTISGTASACIGNNTTLTSSVTGGTWVSGTTSVATVGLTSGVVNGVAAGTSIITYTISSSCGVASTTVVATINPLPSAIGGTAVVCVNANTTLTNTGGGTWASDNTGIATVGSSSGTVTGVAAGTTFVTYTLPTGCVTTRVVTINALPAVIGGTLELCTGTSTTLTNTTTGGTWSSTTTSVAIIGSTSGFVNALSGGNSVINYTAPVTGCVRSAILTVNPAPASITGTLSICLGATTTLNNTSTGGTWSSGNITVATIGSGSGIATGLATGTSAISYILPTGCRRVTTMTVNALPATIGGTPVVCVGSTTTLTNTTTGGTWSSGDGSIATVGATSGIVSGVAAGTADITYTSAGGCIRTINVTVNPLPLPITGTTVLCSGSTTTLSSTTSGGVWISSNTSVATIVSGTGVVTASAAGTSTITYSLATSCLRTVVFSVNPLPSTISGTPNVCAGSTRTLSSSPTGGTWSSSNTAVATVGTGGIVTGVAAGTTTISYELSTGCMRTQDFTVNPLPAAITGTAVVCAGSTTTLSSTTGGGTWSSTATTIATVGVTSGIVTGVSAGTATIVYMLGTGCSVSAVATVNALPSTITGPTGVCVGSTITLASTPTGGTWASSATGTATVGSSSGVVTGVAAGVTFITYTLPTGCTRIATITVNPLPSAGTVSGTSSVCVGATVTLSSTVSGGVWSTTTGKVTVSTTGVVTGVSAGLDTVKYSVSTVCGTATVGYPVTVNALAVAGTISGSSNVCLGLTTTLSASVTGGVWTSAATSIATVLSTGVVTGVALGSTTISYAVTNICNTAYATQLITVIPLADAGAIGGSDSVCQADTIHLSDPATGGTWSSSNTAVATVTSSGVVTGVSAGSATISYTVSNGCSTGNATKVVIVKPTSACTTSIRTTPATAPISVRLYPNPTNGTFTIETPTGGTVRIFTIDGKEINSYIINTTTTAIVLPKGIANGVYMCRFISNDGSSTVVRLVYEQ